MTLLVRDDANVQRTISGVFAIDDGSASREVQQIYARDSGNVSRLVYTTTPALSVTVSDEIVSIVAIGTGTGTTGTTTATPVGGTGPFTYLWTIISYESDRLPSPPTINAPTAATTAFTQTGMTPEDAYSAVFQIQVTDSLMQTATATVTGNFASTS